MGRPAHRLQHRVRGVLERDVEVGKNVTFRHQRDDLVDMRVGIHIVQPHPDTELAERLRQIEKPSPLSAIAPSALCVLDVDPVRAGIL